MMHEKLLQVRRNDFYWSENGSIRPANVSSSSSAAMALTGIMNTLKFV